MNLRNLLALVLPVLLGACGTCGSNDEAVAFAKGLSQQRLAQLVRDLEVLGPSHPSQGRVMIDAGSGIPDSLQDLHPRSIVTDGSMARIHLSGCVDDKVLLLVRGIGNPAQEVSLLPGEAEEAVVLWHSN